MDWVRAAVAVTVGVILVTTVISGPLVGAVDLTPETSDSARPASGEPARATVHILEEPAGPVVLDQGEFGNDVYVLRVPPIRVRVTDVRGAPTVTYKVRIFGLGYTRVSSYVLEPGAAERRALEVTKTSFPPSQITETEYPARLFVTVHDSGGTRIVYQTNTTAVVED